MCVIAICEKRKLTKEEISSIWRIHHDGAGVAWNDGKTVYFKKGFMEEEEFTEFYLNTKLPLPHVVHFRFQSSGEIAPEFTHPFICSPNSPLVLEYKGEQECLFQNGTWLDYESFVEDLKQLSHDEIEGNINDARALAMIRFHTPDMISELPANKFALVRKDSIEKYGKFYNRNGIWFSNVSWVGIPIRTKKAYSYDPSIYCNSSYYSPWWKQEPKKVYRNMKGEIIYGD